MVLEKTSNFPRKFYCVTDQVQLLISNNCINVDKIFWIKVDLTVIVKSCNKVTFKVNGLKDPNKDHI